jgi:hypothetical protein
MLVRMENLLSILTQLFGLPLEPSQNLSLILVSVFVGNTVSQIMAIYW